MGVSRRTHDCADDGVEGARMPREVPRGGATMRTTLWRHRLCEGLAEGGARGGWPPAPGTSHAQE
ncbi:hypothetical protein CXY01_09070 [Cellulomonas xylanilytica]|uniref:Uncharacterized protein n=1 Tax=Cellulomonas xylanilytica TaxID=233583 RepID=A0A510V0E5_9CELL|nr:hypothetical protein CXY01_09070 [Cellulomonas xylanilytica]